MRRLIPLLLILAAGSCSKNNTDLTRFHEDGRAKPAVTIASVMDATSFDASWSLSEELTSLIVQKVAQNSSVYVTSRDEFGCTENPFGKELSWIKREFNDDQFVVFLELVEHENCPVAKGKKKPLEGIPFETSMNMKSAVKMRLVDLRGSTPKIVLQEMIRDSYYIPKNTVPTDYRVATWGTNEYAGSPMSHAHSQLAQEIALRINEYVHLAKSR
jgi:Tfp pilus assembly protein PilP